jgi:hypothetical protein
MVLRGYKRPRVEEERVQGDMFSKYTSVLTLAQWGSEKGRGVFCDNKAKDYRVWRTTLLYYLTSD